jgi:hypothetical protein
MPITARHMKPTKILPHELMFGKKAKLPIDSVFAQATKETTFKTPT